MKSRWLFKIKAAYDDDDDDRDDDDDNVRGVVVIGASWKARADVAPTATSTAADDILMVLDKQQTVLVYYCARWFRFSVSAFCPKKKGRRRIAFEWK